MIAANSVAAAPPKLKPVTVCEVLENLPDYAGKMVAVVGRLSSNSFDGAWLSEGSCSKKVEPSDDPNWPYAIFLGCFEETKPVPVHSKLNLDEKVLQEKLKDLRRTTTLELHEKIVIPDPGKEMKKSSEKEPWSIVYGRIRSATQGAPGRFGAVHAKLQLCAADGSSLDVREPD